MPRVAAAKADKFLEPHVQWSGTSARVIVPLRTVNELNDHTHWRKRQKRAAEQHMVVAAYLGQIGRDFPRDLVAYVEFTRIAPGQGLDPGDNLNSSMKFVRDAVAKWLGIDDGPRCRVKWTYQQRKATQWGVEICMSSFPFRLELAP